jgi:hypothetical protein
MNKNNKLVITIKYLIFKINHMTYHIIISMLFKLGYDFTMEGWYFRRFYTKSNTY